MAQTESDMETH